MKLNREYAVILTAAKIIGKGGNISNEEIIKEIKQFEEEMNKSDNEQTVPEIIPTKRLF